MVLHTQKRGLALLPPEGSSYCKGWRQHEADAARKQVIRTDPTSELQLVSSASGEPFPSVRCCTTPMDLGELMDALARLPFRVFGAVLQKGCRQPLAIRGERLPR